MVMPETDSAVIPFPATEEVPPTAQGGKGGNYEAVRFNAIQHGILSRCTVLPHENADEYRKLLAALIDDHQPTGATEAHLIEELASIIWRKQRVLQAEGAKINRGMESVVRDTNRTIQMAAPFEFGLSDGLSDIRDLMDMPPEEIAEYQRDALHDLEATWKAAAILRSGSANAFEEALHVLLPDSIDLWRRHIEKEEYPETAEGLALFIREHLAPLCIRIEKVARHHEAIKAQALGDGLQVHRLENLTRYETHLDRKFERTLAMLLKVKELRSK